MRYLIDTNVLINDPDAIFKFGEHSIYVPFIVIVELDGLKKRQDETGRSARRATQNIDSLRELGTLNAGVRLKNGGEFFVIEPVSEVKFTHQPMNDDVILQHCLDIGATLITEDVAMRIKADSLGVQVERYKNCIVETDVFDKPNNIVELSPSEIDMIYGKDGVPNDGMDGQYLVAKSGSQSALVRRIAGFLHLVEPISLMGGKAQPKNKEQVFLVDALMDPTVSLVAATGMAGTGKTLLAVAAGLEQTVERDARFKKMVVSRPTTPMGKDIGFLPGTMEEKMEPWMKPIQDSIEFLVKRNGDMFFTTKKIVVESLTFMRGRSLPDQFILIDEAQNLSKHEIKTIVTRAGKGTKIILTGDIEQIDDPYLNRDNNGLTYLINKFNGHRLFAHVHLTKGERSELAELAAKLL